MFGKKKVNRTYYYGSLSASQADFVEGYWEMMPGLTGVTSFNKKRVLDSGLWYIEISAPVDTKEIKAACDRIKTYVETAFQKEVKYHVA